MVLMISLTLHKRFITKLWVWYLWLRNQAEYPFSIVPAEAEVLPDISWLRCNHKEYHSTAAQPPIPYSFLMLKQADTILWSKQDIWICLSCDTYTLSKQVQRNRPLLKRSQFFIFDILHADVQLVYLPISLLHDAIRHILFLDYQSSGRTVTIESSTCGIQKQDKLDFRVLHKLCYICIAKISPSAKIKYLLVA
jgi:hypothetical protein